MKKKQITATQGYFTDYRDMKFKLTAHRLGSENRNTVLWNKNYRNTAPKITQYRNTANPYAPLLHVLSEIGFDIILFQQVFEKAISSFLLVT